MRRRGVIVSPLIAATFCVSYCHEKPADNEIVLRSADFSKGMPTASFADAPEFIRSLSLLYPQSEIFRVDNRIVQKTSHHLADVVAYYRNTLAKHGFAESTQLEQVNGALLRYERARKDVLETISVDVQKLPYAENYLIRLTLNEVERTHGQKE